MSRILKSSTVKVDKENTVPIEVMDASAFASARTQDSPAEHEDFTEGSLEERMEKKASLILIKAERDAANVMRRAETDAQILMEDVKIQADKLAKEISQRSKQEGYDAGYTQGMAETEGLREEARQALEDAYAERERVIQSIEGDMLELVIQTTQKLLGAASVNPDAALYLIRQGLAGATIAGDVFIRVSPEDYEAVAACRDEIAAMAEASSNTSIEILKDASLQSMDCIIETPFGNIDCSLDRQMNGLRRELYLIYENR